MATTYTIKDTTRDLGFMLSLTSLFEMDEQGFWFDPGLGKRHVLKLETSDEGKEVAVFQDPLPKGDIYFFNPFAEGFGKKSPAVTQFYKAIRVAFNLKFGTALLYMINEVRKSRVAAETGEAQTVNHVVVRMSSVPIDEKTSLYDVADDKLIDEFEKILKRLGDEVLFVPYLHQQMTSKVICGALDDSTWDEKYGNGIRKKSLLAFKAAVMGVLGITKPEELSTFRVKYDPELKTSPQIYTTLSVYLKLYHRFNDVLADAAAIDGVPSPSAEIDLGELQNVIDHLPYAYAIAKHMVQPTIPTQRTTDTSTVDTSRLSLSSAGGAHGTVGGSRFPGPEQIDSFGRKIQPAAPALNLGGNTPSTTRRFPVNTLTEAPTDPFAPATRMNPNPGFGGGMFGGGFGAGAPSGGSFGSSSYGFGGQQGGGLNVNPPSNFGSPGMQKSYFR